MRKLAAVFPVTVCLLALLFVQAGRSQESPSTKPASKPGQTAAKTEAVRKAPAGRLPNYFGRLGVSNEQRQRIYAIQADYKNEIDALQKQIDDLVAKRDQEIQAILTDIQREQLKKLIAEAEARREAAAKTREEQRQASNAPPKSGD